MKPIRNINDIPEGWGGIAVAYQCLKLHVKKEEFMIQLSGSWGKGFAFDMHTISSDMIGQYPNGKPIFDTKRTEVGDLLYKLKYNQDISALTKIINLLRQNERFVEFIKEIEVILPIPPSNKARKIQPVLLVAQKLSEEFNKELNVNVLDSTNNEQIKNIDSDEKYDRVKRSIKVNKSIKGRASKSAPII